MSAPSPVPGSTPRQIFADYFTSFQTRDVSGQSDQWRYYHGEKVQWSGDLYLSPGADRKETSTPFYPLIGPYDTLDPDVLEYHILLAKLAGLDGFLCEFSTSQGHDGQVPIRMARLAEKYSFKVGIHWIPVNFTNQVGAENRVEMLEAAKATLRQVLGEVYSRAGVRVNGRPLILIFGVRAGDYLPTVVRDTHFSANEIQALRAAVRDFEPLLLSPHYQTELLDQLDGFYPWVLPYGSPVPANSPYDRIGDLAAQTNHLGHFYAHAQAAVRERRLALFLAGVWPGFDDHRGRAWGEDLARYVPREDGRMLQRTWDLAVRSGASTILQETWNDWVESTIIEPSRELGYAELEATQRRISEWKKLRLSAESLRWPLRLYECRRFLRFLERMGGPADIRSRLSKLAEQTALALSHAPDQHAESLLTSLEGETIRARSLLSQRDVRLAWAAEETPAGLEVASREQSETPPAVVLNLKPAALPWQQVRGLTGRLQITFLDDNRLFLRIVQVNPGEPAGVELARFRKTGTQTWRTVELDIHPLFWDDTKNPFLEIRVQASEEGGPEHLQAASLELRLYRLEEGRNA
ncbi:MAG: hypothetical protein AB1439_01920 [candidate division FCPU426 bacterium]